MASGVPDKHPHADEATTAMVTKRFQLLRSAIETLSDADARSAYDASLPVQQTWAESSPFCGDPRARRLSVAVSVEARARARRWGSFRGKLA